MRYQQGMLVTRLLTTLFMVSLAVLIAFGLWKLHQPDFLPIKSVKVQGTYQKVGRNDLQHLLSPMVSTTFFSVDVNQIKEKLLAMPWIADVSVQRIWPDTIQVAVKEQHAISRWNDNSLLNDQGQVFTPSVQESISSLPRLNGPEKESGQVMAFFYECNRILKPIGLSVAQLDLSERRAWYLKLNNGIEIYLGRDEVMARLQRFIALYSRSFAARASEIGYIDARYSDGVAVHWKQAKPTQLIAKN